MALYDISSPAVSQSYLGYNTAGGTSLTIGTNSALQILKPVTIGSAPVLLNSIDLYCHGDGNHSFTYYVAVWTDNAGAPGRQTAFGTAVTAFLDTNDRWLVGGISAWLSAGTSYWLYAAIVNTPSASTSVVHYDSGGGDYTGTSTVALNDGLGPTNSSRNYSLRGSTI